MDGRGDQEDTQKREDSKGKGLVFKQQRKDSLAAGQTRVQPPGSGHRGER